MFDGNLLSYRAASAWLQKPWMYGPESPWVPSLRREQRHPIWTLTAVQRRLLRDLLHRGRVVILRSTLEAACDAAEQSLPGFSQCIMALCTVSNDTASAEEGQSTMMSR